MADLEALKEHLGRLTQELAEVKKIVIGLETVDIERTEGAWDDLMSAAVEISRRWEGPSAVEEIRLQREKIDDLPDIR